MADAGSISKVTILSGDTYTVKDPNAVSFSASQSLTSAQQTTARTNIGAGTYSKPSGGIPDSDISSAATWNAKSNFSGAYADLTGKPNAVTYTQNSNVSVAGTTKTTYTYGQNPIYTPNGIIVGGTAAAGLVTRGVCGINSPTTGGACQKDNLYLNYDGDNTYRNNRQVVIQAGTTGTHYGSNLYQYCAARGDAVKGYVDGKVANYGMLPTATSSNNGKVLCISDGSWGLDWQDKSSNLPYQVIPITFDGTNFSTTLSPQDIAEGYTVDSTDYPPYNRASFTKADFMGSTLSLTPVYGNSDGYEFQTGIFDLTPFGYTGLDGLLRIEANGGYPNPYQVTLVTWPASYPAPADIGAIPAPQSAQTGQVLGYTANGWGAVSMTSLPAVTASDNGKALRVVNGAWEAVQSGGDYISYSSAQTLTSAQIAQAQSNIGLTRIVANNVSVAASSWVADNTYTNYPYKATISFSGATADLYPEVIFSPADALSGNYAPVAESGTNVVYIYAKEDGAVAMTIPTIIVH